MFSFTTRFLSFVDGVDQKGTIKDVGCPLFFQYCPRSLVHSALWLHNQMIHIVTCQPKEDPFSLAFRFCWIAEDLWFRSLRIGSYLWMNLKISQFPVEGAREKKEEIEMINGVFGIQLKFASFHRKQSIWRLNDRRTNLLNGKLPVSVTSILSSREIFETSGREESL